MSHLMIFGAGYSGKAIARAMMPTIKHISGTTRSAEKSSALEAAGISPLVFDGEVISHALRQGLASVTHVVQSIAPGASGDPLIRLCDGDIRRLMPKLEWAAYLSTVGVYGDHAGAWVNEDTQCRPVSVRSTERVEAENAWTSVALQADIPVVVLRLSGIYGPGRNGFMNLDKGTARRLVKKDQVFNRIRVEDIGAATAFLSAQGASGIFNISDEEHAPPQVVVTFAAAVMGMEPPPEQAFETAELTPMARSFYGENKRVSNEKIRAMGFDFRFPNYRESLRQLWNDGVWRG